MNRRSKKKVEPDDLSYNPKTYDAAWFNSRARSLGGWIYYLSIEESKRPVYIKNFMNHCWDDQ